MKIHYSKIEHNLLFEALQNEEISTALTYMIDAKKHRGLKIIPNEHSIELSNDEITIAIILYVGFEDEEYNDLKNRKNLHVITFFNVVPSMVEFNNLNVKYIDNLALLATTLALSEKTEYQALNHLRSINC